MQPTIARMAVCESGLALARARKPAAKSNAASVAKNIHSGSFGAVLEEVMDSCFPCHSRPIPVPAALPSGIGTKTARERLRMVVLGPPLRLKEKGFEIAVVE